MDNEETPADKPGFGGEMELAYCCFSVFLKTTVVSETSLLLFSEFLDFNSKKFKIMWFYIPEVS